MYVFIDNSGDPGFKFDKGSSRFFVIACCVFETAEAAESATLAIRRLALALGRPETVEFKFAKSRRETQEKFFHSLEAEDFVIWLVVVDKQSAEGLSLGTGKTSLQQEVVLRALSYSENQRLPINVIIDGGGSRQYRQVATFSVARQMSADFRRGIRKVTYARSHSDPLLQLADMVAGCAHRIAQSKDGQYLPFVQMLRPFLDRPGSHQEIIE